MTKSFIVGERCVVVDPRDGKIIIKGKVAGITRESGEVTAVRVVGLFTPEAFGGNGREVGSVTVPPNCVEVEM